MPLIPVSLAAEDPHGLTDAPPCGPCGGLELVPRINALGYQQQHLHPQQAEGGMLLPQKAQQVNDGAPPCSCG
jgi:hypothetical protein